MSLEWARARLRENCAQMRELHEALGTAVAPPPAKASLMLVETYLPARHAVPADAAQGAPGVPSRRTAIRAGPGAQARLSRCPRRGQRRG